MAKPRHPTGPAMTLGNMRGIAFNNLNVCADGAGGGCAGARRTAKRSNNSNEQKRIAPDRAKRAEVGGDSGT
jgi:hypothetical protein